MPSHKKINLVVALLILLSSVVSYWPYLDSSAQQINDNNGRDFFFANGERIPLAVALNKIGIVVRDEEAIAESKQLMSRNRAKAATRTYPRGIVIHNLDQPLAREEIVKLARKIKNESNGSILHAGLVATPGRAETPFIVTDEFIVKFKDNVSAAQARAFAERNGVEFVSPLHFVKNQFLLKVTEASRLDALDMANRLHQHNELEFAHPNFVRVVDYRQVIPNDTLFGNQWHHDNTGQGSGTVDADVDTPFAWSITQGTPDRIIAVIDDGFDLAHPDLSPNLWVNAGEIAGNGIDDDRNSLIDDVNGADTRNDDGNPSPAFSDENHGTAVAGVVGARGNNMLGVSGSCPNCSLMFIRHGSAVADDSQAFGYAQQMGAHVITNSWGYTIGTPTTTSVVNAINQAATNGRGGLGCVVLFAMNNINLDDCIGTTPDISSIPNVIAVSASSNQERKVTESAFGNCMDVIAPTHRGYGNGTAFSGTLNIATTDRSGTNGYNNFDPFTTCPSTEPAPGAGNARDYTLCFGGTSSATPVVAGVAGLILSVNNTLNRAQVQQLIQDTTDKIQDSTGSYATANGFSNPAGGVASHGWGRINAYEAVRVAAPVNSAVPFVARGRGGVDLFIRDNRLDWGNTEQPSNSVFEQTRGYIPHWESVDIKVDAPPLQPAPSTSAAFDALTDESPQSGLRNKVYVRVRNRGPVAATNVTVKLHWAFAGTLLPALPRDFWSRFPQDSIDDTSIWHPLGTSPAVSLAYSGSSAANTATDGARIATFDFDGPPLDPARPNPEHHCLLAIIDSTEDRPGPKIRPTISFDFVPDQLTPNDNNITHRNLRVLNTLSRRDVVERLYVRNPTKWTVESFLSFDAPRGWKVSLKGQDVKKRVFLRPGEEHLIDVTITPPEPNAIGQVTVTQELSFDCRTVKGGMSFRFGPAKSN